jgi:hypothetical protein
MSSNLYNTLGNEVKYDIVQDTLVAYLKDATIQFPLPEASSELLANLTKRVSKTYDPAKVGMVVSKLEKLGFKKGPAKAMASVLFPVAESQGVDPLEYFDVNENSLNLTTDAYVAINKMRPAGSRVGLIAPTLNSTSKAASLIKP